ncbi:MAG: GntR family transcriptional regulator [Victivallales bacterium]|jgi:DNA-binding GntR family transcriptional regulator|nr:GntR family transcriptional regulator [Victivallales bacterium]
MLKKTNLSEQAYRLLIKRIIEGRYPAGTRLTEESLAKEFGISRTPLREALRRLVVEGILEEQPRRGLRVMSPSREEISELFECRCKIEPPILRENLPNIPKAELQKLRDRIVAGDAEESLAVDEAMHKLIAEYCGNRFLKEIIENLIRRTAPYRTLRNCTIPELPRSERIELLDVMLSGDRDRAAELLIHHFRFNETDPST